MSLTLHELADLDDDALARAYAPERTPWLRMNFVSTVDGAAQGADGLSGGINNEPDHRVYAALRRRADVVVVGAGTARAEGYRPAEVPVVVVSRHGEVPTRLCGAARGRVLLATVDGAHVAGARAELGDDAVLLCGEGEVDMVDLKRQLAERGWGEQLCEGGPALFASALACGAVDELCLSVVPRLVAGDRYRITRGAAVDVALRPTHLFHQDGTLLGRWRVTSDQ